jgi:hypothetical protein
MAEMMTQTWASKLWTTSAAVKWMKAVGLLRTYVLFHSMDLHSSFHIKFVAKPSALFYKLTYSASYMFPHHVVLVIIFLTSSSTLVIHNHMWRRVQIMKLCIIKSFQSSCFTYAIYCTKLSVSNCIQVWL